jgi:hypothetical protein
VAVAISHTMWTKATLAIDMLKFEIEAYRQQGVTDPFAACGGLVWWRALLRDEPALSAEDLRLRYEAELPRNGRAREWARGLLTNQGHLLYPAFRATLIAGLSDGTLAHMVCEGFAFTAQESGAVKDRIRGRFSRHPNYQRIRDIVDG